jgi:hypothetical protein
MSTPHPQALDSPTSIMAHFDLPLRNRKNLARAAQLRNFAIVGRLFNPRSTLPADYEDPYLPISRHRPDRSLSVSHYAAAAAAASPLTSYNTDQSTDVRLADPYTYRPSSYPRRTDADYTPSTSTRLSFAKAARGLYRALDGAYRHIAWLEDDFRKDMLAIPYADERARIPLDAQNRVSQISMTALITLANTRNACSTPSKTCEARSILWATSGAADSGVRGFIRL